LSLRVGAEHDFVEFSSCIRIAVLMFRGQEHPHKTQDIPPHVEFLGNEQGDLDRQGDE
jgi:hypothetical protein